VDKRLAETCLGMLRYGLVQRVGRGRYGRVERSCAVFRSALYSPFAPAFRFRECHSIRPCTAQSLSLTEACLRDYRTSLFIQSFTTSG
jgi:hypothetical protein